MSTGGASGEGRRRRVARFGFNIPVFNRDALCAGRAGPSSATVLGFAHRSRPCLRYAPPTHNARHHAQGATETGSEAGRYHDVVCSAPVSDIIDFLAGVARGVGSDVAPSRTQVSYDTTRTQHASPSRDPSQHSALPRNRDYVIKC